MLGVKHSSAVAARLGDASEAVREEAAQALACMEDKGAVRRR